MTNEYIERLKELLPVTAGGNLPINKENSKKHGEVFTPESIILKMIEKADPQPGEKILDLCAGYGNFTAYLTEWMWQKHNVPYNETLKNVWLSEINPESIKKIRYVFGNKAQIIEGDAKELKAKRKINQLF